MVIILANSRLRESGDNSATGSSFTGSNGAAWTGSNFTVLFRGSLFFEPGGLPFPLFGVGGASDSSCFVSTFLLLVNLGFAYALKHLWIDTLPALLERRTRHPRL